MPSSPPLCLIQHNFFGEIRPPTKNKHVRIVVIGQQQIQKPMKLSQIEKRIPQTLTNPKGVIQNGREYARRSSRARSTRGRKHKACALYEKKIHPGCPGLTFLGTDSQLYQSQPPLLEIHVLEGYCSLETNATCPSKLHVLVHAYKHCHFTRTVLRYYHRAWVTCGFIVNF